jgi:methyl coenzyme M reductase subunit C-like uncharacterized protein (methanogenesis marker protein 7)
MKKRYFCLLTLFAFLSSCDLPYELLVSDSISTDISDVTNVPPELLKHEITLINKNKSYNFEIVEGHIITNLHIAKALYEKYHDEFKNIKFDENKILDPKVNEIIKEFSKNYMLNMIKEDLNEIGVTFDL